LTISQQAFKFFCLDNVLIIISALLSTTLRTLSNFSNLAFKASLAKLVCESLNCSQTLHLEHFIVQVTTRKELNVQVQPSKNNNSVIIILKLILIQVTTMQPRCSKKFVPTGKWLERRQSTKCEW